MHHVERRRFLASAGLTAGGLVLPRFAIGQIDDRPTINIAVQQVSTSASLEVVRERSNVALKICSASNEAGKSSRESCSARFLKVTARCALK